MHFSLVIPCYNEELAIPSMAKRLSELLNVAKSISPNFLKLDIHIVDDGSQDKTPDLLNQLDIEGLFIHTSTARLGYGGAIKLGIEKSRGHHIAILDMDDTYNPLDLIKLWENLNQTDSSMVVGNRFTNLSQMPKLRSFGNGLYIKLLRVLTQHPIQDPCSGIRIFSREVFSPFFQDLPNDLSFALALTTLSLTKGFALTEVPVTYNHRLGESKLNEIKDGIGFLHTIFKYRKKEFFPRSISSNSVN